MIQSTKLGLKRKYDVDIQNYPQQELDKVFYRI